MEEWKLREIGLTKKECLTLLRSYYKQMELILTTISDGTRLRVEGILRAQPLLKELKCMLREAYNNRNTQTGGKQMSSFEEQYFFPAIHETLTRIRIKSNTRPNNAWIDQLYEAQSTVSFWINQMEASKD